MNSGLAIILKEDKNVTKLSILGDSKECTSLSRLSLLLTQDFHLNLDKTYCGCKKDARGV